MSNDMTVEQKRSESTVKKALLYIEMDELHRLLRKSFGESFIRFDPNDFAQVLIDSIKKDERYSEWDGLELAAIRIYISHPGEDINPRQAKFWNGVSRFWYRNLGIPTICHPLEIARAMVIPENQEEQEFQKWNMGRIYSSQTTKNYLVADVIEDLMLDTGDVVILVSKDYSFSAIADKIRKISSADNRWIKVISAFPYKESEEHKGQFRGIPGTDWFHITENQFNDFKQDAPERDSSVD